MIKIKGMTCFLGKHTMQVVQVSFVCFVFAWKTCLVCCCPCDNLVRMLKNRDHVLNSWFTHNIRAPLLVVKNKNYPFYRMGSKLHFQVVFENNVYCVDHQHGHHVMWLQTKNKSTPLTLYVPIVCKINFLLTIIHTL